MHLPMAALSKLKSALDIKTQFPHHFPDTDFVLGTFYKHRKPFLQVVTLGLIQPMTDMGRTDGAEWSQLKAEVECWVNAVSTPQLHHLSDLDLTALVNELQTFNDGSISLTDKSSEPLELAMDFFSSNMPSFNDFVDFSGSSLF
ncbi:hypothetical protein PAXRUDRAFT_28766 [Paxillus rubicundulus Ve08.2h10]|uniref:Unplaced genomic scaffold scaffold_2060, whole genome shotgun sequence n=1 Tax=Paxillus rubicundulus Ve08.2h10 TaxID=930991 RepID=A0A0D0CQN5_9AGAM|nr:hypothetical protein PAXRUDRAFT_28766 [Paxillus rubicundulus Ve08.2h10]